jgi:hypothetical protein
MALVRKFEYKSMDRNSVHDEIEATVTAFHKDSRTFIQIDTYGTSERQIPGKKSQSIQLGEAGASALYQILKKEFRFG